MHRLVQDPVLSSAPTLEASHHRESRRTDRAFISRPPYLKPRVSLTYQVDPLSAPYPLSRPHIVFVNQCLRSCGPVFTYTVRLCVPRARPRVYAATFLAPQTPCPHANSYLHSNNFFLDTVVYYEPIFPRPVISWNLVLSQPMVPLVIFVGHDSVGSRSVFFLFQIGRAHV